MSSIEANFRLILEKIIKIKPSQSLLVTSDTYARSRFIANMVADMAISMGVPTVLAVSERGEHVGVEPPPAIYAAMKTVDVIFDVNEKVHLFHTTAGIEVARGKKVYIAVVDVSEDYLRQPISFEDLELVKTRTEKVAEIMSGAKVARVTTPYGTDLTMSLEGRQAIAIHPLGEEGGPVPDCSEAAIAPVEGTTEGVIVVDASIRGSGIPPYILRKPIRFEVKGGRVQPETISSELVEQAERLRKAVSLDENASNCAAELGIGTSHFVSKTLRGDFMRDYALAGTFHIAFGRNDDIGGKTHSNIHSDVLLTGGSVKLDDVCVVKDGQLKV